MWAAQLTAPGRFSHVAVHSPTEDDLKPGEVVLDVIAGGICGSDLPLYRGAIPRAGALATDPHAGIAPGTPMHEVVGEVVATKDPDLPRGTRVVGWALNQNALAERTITHGSSVLPVDTGLAPGLAVALQPLACVIYAVERLGSVFGQRVAVLGQGPIGVLFSHVLKHLAGAGYVIGVDRVDRAGDAAVFGVDEIVHASADRWANGLGERERPSVIVEAIGHQVTTLSNAIEAAADNGLVFYFGVPDDLVYPIPMHTLYRKNLQLRSGNTKDRRRVLKCAADYARTHPGIIEAYVTHRLSITEPQRAFDLATTPRAGQLKIVLEK